MEWNELKLLLAVARSGSASAAAASLGVSHATVSRRVAEIEAKLGVVLVDRSGLTWKTTPICQQLAGHAEKMEAHSAEAHRIARAFSTETTGSVEISVPTGALTAFVAEALQDFPVDHPEIELIFTTADTFVDLPGRKADLAVRFTASPDQDLIGEMVAHSEWAVYALAKWVQVIEDHKASNALPEVPVLTTNEDNSLPDWAVGKVAQSSRCHYAYGFNEKAALAEKGFGLVVLPCIIGDKAPQLLRLPQSFFSRTSQLWVLANSDTRKSNRIAPVKRALITGLKRMGPKLNPSTEN